jgi:two-component system, OmpR family, alkaline phosphatase synthesis response regulator PhoP
MSDSNMVILLADDEPHVTFMLSMKLSRSNTTVLVANDGEEALTLAMKHKPDLIITDYQMPRMSGLELAMKLGQSEATAEIPIIMLTARGHRVAPSDLVQTNIRQLMSKPFSAKELLAVVAEFITLNEADQSKGLAA